MASQSDKFEMKSSSSDSGWPSGVGGSAMMGWALIGANVQTKGRKPFSGLMAVQNSLISAAIDSVEKNINNNDNEPEKSTTLHH